MIVYNVTTRVEQRVAADWLVWLKEEHIPDLIQTGCFTHAVILKLIDTDDSEGPTYAVQYHAESKSLYERYIEHHAENMRQKALDRWGNNFIAFRTLMQSVN